MDYHVLAQAVFKPFLEITLGNVLTLGTMAIGGFVAWGKLMDKVDTMKARQDEHQKRLDEFSNAGMPMVCRLHTERLESIEERLQELPVQLSAMSADLTWIKHTMERNSQNQRSQ